MTPTEIAPEELDEIEVYLAKIPEGPYFVGFDDAKDCGPHKQSGLAMVDTAGQTGVWPIARLCEWPVAEFIRNARTDLPRLLTAYREQAAELERLRAQLNEIAEREAACCPEDCSFDEVIKSLRARVVELERENGEFAHEIDLNRAACSNLPELHRELMREIARIEEGH